MQTDWTWDAGPHLKHHGIKGQKWGVRRYQNPDGTLTAAGKKHQQKEYYKAFKYQFKSVRHDPIRNYDHSSYKRAYEIIPEDKRKQLVQNGLDWYKARTKKERDRISKEGHDLAEAIMRDLVGKKRMNRLGYTHMMRVAKFEAGEEVERIRKQKKRRDDHG